MTEQARVEKMKGLTQVDVKLWFFGVDVDRRYAVNVLERRLGSEDRVHSFLVGPISSVMKDFEAKIEIDVDEGGLWVTLKTNKWGGSMHDDGYITAEKDPPEDLVKAVNAALSVLMQDKDPFEEVQA